MKHIIITRFNVPIFEVELSEQWLRDRLVLTKKILLPSLLGQSEQDFTWILLFDKDSPDWLVAELKLLVGLVKQGKLVAVEEMYHLRNYIKERYSAPYLLTRFDTDDIMSSDFVQLTQETASLVDKTRMIFHPWGYVYYRGHVLLRSDNLAAYCSLYDKEGDIALPYWATNKLSFERGKYTAAVSYPIDGSLNKFHLSACLTTNLPTWCWVFHQYGNLTYMRNRLPAFLERIKREKVGVEVMRPELRQFMDNVLTLTGVNHGTE